ncbi:MAG: WD40 repeat domain-containing protein [Anaerolineales bacterium]|nr:WD40 repeat domain-containing protein [Anaerolineales bacterium]
MYKAILFAAILALMVGCAKAEPTLDAIPTGTLPATALPATATSTAPASTATTAAALPSATPRPTLTLRPPTQTAVIPTMTSPDDLAVISADTAGQVTRLTTLAGHNDRVVTLAFSHDGVYLASAGWDRTIKLWDVWSGVEVHAFSLPEGDLNAIAFSPVHNWLASADAIWDVETLEVVLTMEHDSHESGHVAFSPDGSLLAVDFVDEPIRFWDIARGEVVRSFEAQDDVPVFGIEFSPDGSLIAGGANGGIVYLWDVASGQMVATLGSDSGPQDVHDVAFSPDGIFLASAGTNYSARLWNIASGETVFEMPHGNGMYGVTISPDGSLVATAVCDRTVRLWDAASGKLLRTLSHGDEVISVAFSPDGRLLVSGGYDNLIYVWGVIP